VLQRCFGSLKRLPTELWGIQKGKADGVRGEPSVCWASCGTPRALVARLPCN